MSTGPGTHGGQAFYPRPPAEAGTEPEPPVAPLIPPGRKPPSALLSDGVAAASVPHSSRGSRRLSQWSARPPGDGRFPEAEANGSMPRRRSVLVLVLVPVLITAMVWLAVAANSHANPAVGISTSSHPEAAAPSARGHSAPPPVFSRTEAAAAPPSVGPSAAEQSASPSPSPSLSPAAQQADHDAAVRAASASAGQHLAVVESSAGSAYAFALSGSGTLMFAAQSGTGPGGWSAFSTLPDSPTDLVSAPAATTDRSGLPEVFARDVLGHVEEGRLSSGGWQWGTVASGAIPEGTPVGIPSAVLQSDGDIEVFVGLSSGAVATSWQLQPDGADGWSGWSSLGGELGGDPVAFREPAGGLDLFGRSAAGTLVADLLNGTRWQGWFTVGSSPTDLAQDPKPASNENGQTELFAPTSSGGMDSVWGSRTGTWTWGVPLTGNQIGSAVQSTPSFIAWPDGHLEIYARLVNGELAHAWQNTPNGVTDWSLWGTLPGAADGAPAAFVNQSGAPEVMMLGPSSEVEFLYWLGTQWSAPVSIPGSI